MCCCSRSCKKVEYYILAVTTCSDLNYLLNESSWFWKIEHFCITKNVNNLICSMLSINVFNYGKCFGFPNLTVLIL